MSTERDGVVGLAEGNLKNGRIIEGLPFPKTYLPADKCSPEDLIATVTENRAKLWDSLYDHGALLFRGFHVHSVDDISRVVEAFGWEEQPYEGAANRVKRGHRVYTTTEVPLHIFIPFHHEIALIKETCTKVFFYCLVPASEGGETSIVRSDIVVKKMEEAVPEAMEKIKTDGIMPVHRTKNADMSADDKELDPNRKLWHRLLKTDNEEEARKRAMEKLSCTSCSEAGKGPKVRYGLRMQMKGPGRLL